MALRNAADSGGDVGGSNGPVIGGIARTGENSVRTKKVLRRFMFETFDDLKSCRNF